MKKLLSIVLALVLVLGNLPVFAEGYNVQPTAGENLKHYGFIRGNENGDIMPEKTLTRAELAVMLADIHGKREEAKAFMGDSGYADAASFPEWAAPFISFAKAQGWMKGKEGNIFDPLATVGSEELAAVLVRALGYEKETQIPWGQYGAKLVELKIPYVVANPLTRGEAFNMIWPAVSEPVAVDGKVLGFEVGKLPPLKPIVKDLMVESVRADNLKEIVVTFNHEVAKDSIAAANFSLSPAVSGQKLTAELREDAKTVVITVEKALSNQKEYKLTSDKAVAAADATIKLAKTETAFTAFDAQLPEVLSMEFTGPRHITLTFSEPVQKKDAKVTVKSGTSVLSVNTSGITGDGTRVLTVPLYSNLADGKEYEVMVTNFKDFAEYSNIIKNFTATYMKDTTAPVASIVAAEQEYVVVEFSKPVTGVMADNFSHTFSAYKALKVTEEADHSKPAVGANQTVKKVYVWFYIPGEANSRALAEGANKVMIFGKATSQVADLWGNKLADMEIAVNVAADKGAPEVKSVKLEKATKSETEFKVTFTKTVDFEAKHLDVLDKDGKALTGVAILVDPAASAAKEFTVKILGKNLQGETLIINIKGAKDTTLNQNKMVEYSAALEISDKTAPEFKLVTIKKIAGEPGKPETDSYYLYAFFTENMDASALAAVNYQLVYDGSGDNEYSSLPNDGSFVNGNATVEFPLPNKLGAKIDAAMGDYFLLATNVKDVAGNLLEVRASDYIVEHTTGAVPMIVKNEATALGTNKVELTIDSIVTIENMDAFKVNGVAPSSMDLNYKGAKTIVTLYGTDTNSFNLDKNENGSKKVTVENNKIKNEFGNSLATGAAAAIQDGIAPKVAKDGIKMATGGAILVTLDQDVDAALAPQFAHDFLITLNGTAQTPVSKYTTTAAGNVITITFTTALPANYTLVVAPASTVGTYVKDAAGNSLQKFDVKTFTQP